MTQLSLTPIAVFINITTAESWYRQDWETSRRKVNTTHFLVSTLFTLFANNCECVRMESVFEWEEPWFPDWRDKVTMLNVSDHGEVGGWRLDVTIWSGESPQPQEQFSNLVSLRSVSSSLVQVLSSTSSNKQHYYPTLLPFPLPLLWGVTMLLHSPWSQYNTKCW